MSVPRLRGQQAHLSLMVLQKPAGAFGGETRFGFGRVHLLLPTSLSFPHFPQHFHNLES